MITPVENTRHYNLKRRMFCNFNVYQRSLLRILANELARPHLNLPGQKTGNLEFCISRDRHSIPLLLEMKPTGKLAVFRETWESGLLNSSRWLLPLTHCHTMRKYSSKLYNSPRFTLNEKFAPLPQIRVHLNMRSPSFCLRLLPSRVCNRRFNPCDWIRITALNCKERREIAVCSVPVIRLALRSDFDH